MKRRAEFTITFSVDLDLLPGACHTIDWWIDYVTRDFMRQSHYNASFEVKETQEFKSGMTPQEFADRILLTEATAQILRDSYRASGSPCHLHEETTDGFCNTCGFGKQRRFGGTFPNE